ncbi:MAG: SpoIIE family protein phosphatase [Candidatus Eremiobacteraeota bacterium]|nr:SpoIIE family protein phosphatase [Candidatus Eremiobacteraeota bacterium]MBV8374467.1 SpoIIE family protein phosphatase [Candidatus Eremiobacteraeota bacterium]
MLPTAAASDGRISALDDIRAFADALPHWIWLIDGNDRLTFVNAALRDEVGLDVGASLEQRLGVVHPDDRGALLRVLKDRLPECEVRVRDLRDGAYRWHLVRWLYVSAPDGSHQYRVGTGIDVHERHVLEERQAFMSEASRAINASLNLNQTLRAIVRRTVATLADWCEIDLFGREGVVTRAIAHARPELDRSLQAVVGRVHDHNPTEHYERIEAALRAGKTLLTRYVLDEMSEAVVPDPEMLASYKMAGVASSVIVPLASRERVLGWIVFMRTDPSNPYSESDLGALEDFAGRAALAIDNAQIFGREHRLAHAMQSASLPRRLPKVSNLDMHAVYVPGHGEAQIGGDWYDAFRLYDGRVVISIGDVVGSGVDAAVTMSNMRQVIRGAAQIHPDPVLMLDAADSALRLEDGERYVTAFVAVIDPVTRMMSYASAGHPPPYFCTATAPPVALTFDDLPLGLRGRSVRYPTTLQLTPRSILVLYTDGLIETTRNIVDGIAALETLLGSNQFYNSANPAKFIRSRMLDRGALDDVAILSVLVRADSDEASDCSRRIYCWTYGSIDSEVLCGLRERLAHVLEEHGLRHHAVERAKVVLGELLGNVARHAPGPLQIVVDLTSPTPVLHVVDEGKGCAPRPALPPDVLSEGGRGLFIVSELTREFTITRDTGGGTHARAVLAT